MNVPLLVPLLLGATPAVAPATELPDPPVQVWFDSDARYDQGDRVRVFARALSDGYMVILHADPDGRVRVLFPLDPVQDDFVRGGQTLEILGRGDEGAFTIVGREGTGMVVAAWSPDPFWFEGLIRADHWDYRSIAPNGVGSDAEAGLLDIVHAMAAGRPYEYNSAPYFVGDYGRTSTTYVSVGLGTAFCVSCDVWRYDARPGFSLSLSIGGPFWHATYRTGSYYYGPYRYRPVRFDPFWDWYWYDSFRPIRYYDPYWYDPYRWDPWGVRPFYASVGPRWGVRYAGCWGDCWNRYRPPPRPGRATGISFGDSYRRFAGEPGRSPGQGIGRSTGPTRYAVPKDGDQRSGTGRGVGQATRVGQAAVQASPPPSRTRETPSVVRGDGSTRGVATGPKRSSVPVVTSTPQSSDGQRPSRTAVVRSGGTASTPDAGRSAVTRGVGQTRSSERTSSTASSSTRIVPRTSTGSTTRPTERAATARQQVLPSRSSGSTTRSVPSTRSGVAGQSPSTTRVVPSTRSSGQSSQSTRAVPSTRSSSGNTRVVPQPSRSSGSTSRTQSTRPSSAGVSRAVPSRSSSSAGATRSSGSARPAPARSSSGSVSRSSPPARSSGSASSSGSRSSGGVASRARSSGGVAKKKNN